MHDAVEKLGKINQFVFSLDQLVTFQPKDNIIEEIIDANDDVAHDGARMADRWRDLDDANIRNELYSHFYETLNVYTDVDTLGEKPTRGTFSRLANMYGVHVETVAYYAKQYCLRAMQYTQEGFDLYIEVFLAAEGLKSDPLIETYQPEHSLTPTVKVFAEKGGPSSIYVSEMLATVNEKWFVDKFGVDLEIETIYDDDPNYASEKLEVGGITILPTIVIGNKIQTDADPIIEDNPDFFKIISDNVIDEPSNDYYSLYEQLVERFERPCFSPQGKMSILGFENIEDFDMRVDEYLDEIYGGVTDEQEHDVRSILNEYLGGEVGRIPFSKDIVDDIFEHIPDDIKYIYNEDGSIMQKDEYVLVRDYILSLGYILDPAWHVTRGGMAPRNIGTQEARTDIIEMKRLVEGEIDEATAIQMALRYEFMSPKRFKKYYSGDLKHMFKYVKDQHNRFLGVTTLGKLQKLWKSDNYYGVIYKITQVKDQNGNVLNSGPAWILKGRFIKEGFSNVGRTVRGINQRLNEYKYRANDPDLNNNFQVALHDSGWHSFKVSILAVCKTEREFKATEVFWQLYANRDDYDLQGFNLLKNNLFNRIIGSWGDRGYVIPKHFLVRDILNGLKDKEIREKYSYGANPISPPVLSYTYVKYFGSVPGGGLHLTHIRRKLVYPLLNKFILEGYNELSALEMLRRSGVNSYDTYKNPLRTFRSDVKALYEDTINFDNKGPLSTYEQVRLRLFFEPYVEYLRVIGIESFLSDINAPVIIERATGRFVGRFSGIEHPIDLSTLSIAEILLEHELGGLQIAVLLGLCAESDSNYDKSLAVGKLRGYIEGIWEQELIGYGITYSLQNLKSFLMTKSLTPFRYNTFFEYRNL